LIDRDRGDLEHLLPDAAFRRQHPRGPQSADELWERVVAARVRGYALADEEFEPGLVAVAGTVRDFRGRVVAAVSVSAPKFRFARRLEEAGEQVRTVAGELSRMLGWEPERPLSSVDVNFTDAAAAKRTPSGFSRDRSPR
jgi:DNA-binding IclR family transcriptional regulator